MDDLNEMARLHSAGAIRHNQPFNSMRSHQNNAELTQEFITKWVVPHYMEIGKYGMEWIEPIKKIKGEITKEVCLLLLGDFNWRTRLVGAYFAAVKAYTEFIDIIGTHFLKSEVCCVGHIYALTLTYFNNEKSIHYLDTYLDYYLTKPDLYFDQKHAMEAVLYLDKINGTNIINNHLEGWVSFLKERKKLGEKTAVEVAKILEQREEIVGKFNAILKKTENEETIRFGELTTGYFEGQVKALQEIIETAD